MEVSCDNHFIVVIKHHELKKNEGVFFSEEYMWGEIALLQALKRKWKVFLVLEPMCTQATWKHWNRCMLLGYLEQLQSSLIILVMLRLHGRV